MKRRTNSGRKGESGIVILIVAVVLLFIVAAIAALAIDLVTFYTARSEAQLAAEGAALAGARALANSGMTSDPSNNNVMGMAETQARTLAIQVAQQNDIGGKNPAGSGTGLNCGKDICVSLNSTDPTFGANPHITVQVSRNDLPIFFGRIWGRTSAAVTATATAEAYNPSGLNLSGGGGVPRPPVAPNCVKPLILPNIDSTSPTGKIFNVASGHIDHPALLGTQQSIRLNCPGGDCTGPPAPNEWRYYPGAQSSFPAPVRALPACGVVLTAYQTSIAGCVTTPIACGANSVPNSSVNIDTSIDANRRQETLDAINCLTHTINNKGDSIEHLPPAEAFQFEGGAENPIPAARGSDIMVSDSLVTVPVFDESSLTNPVRVIGFLQLFLNPDGHAASPPLQARVVNMVGCGTNANGHPILGNGGSPVAVRLISAQ